MSRRLRLLAVGLCLALSGAASGKTPVRKPPSRVVLDYRRLTGAERCPTKAELEAQVTDILGRPSFARKAPRTVRCLLQGEGGAIAARVQLLDSRTRRVLGVRELSGTGPGCEELGGAVALAIALAIDPLARPPRPPPPAATVSATPPMPAPAAPITAPGSAPTLSGPSASAAGVGAAGVSAAPRSSPPVRGGLLADAGPLTPLPLAPLALAQPPDAGRPPPAPDAGPPPVDAGPPILDAGVALAVDAGVSDAGIALAVDAGVPDAGVEATVGGEPVLVAVPAPARTGWRPVVGVEAIGAAGVLPGFAVGALVHAGAASSTASIEVEGRWLPGTRQTYGTGSVSTSLVSGALVGCARFGSWGACGLALAGPVSAKGEGYSRSQEASAWMVSAGARAQWEWLFADPVGLRLHLDGAVNLVRPRFLVDSQEAFAVPPLSVWVGGGLFGRF